MSMDPQATALLAHVFSQIQTNVDFLVSQNYISPADASAIMSRLPSDTTIMTQLPARMQNLSVSSASQAPARRNPPPPTEARKVQARALWPYNEDGREPNDLSFSEGDIIEIIREENEDWWKGRFNGKEALFPSSYVEKIDSTVSAPRTLPPQYSGPTLTSSEKRQKPAYRPFGAALHEADMPPPAGGSVNSVGLQEAPGQEAKKNKFGQYKNTLAHSAAGGVGFGAGSAIGGGLVRAIF